MPDLYESRSQRALPLAAATVPLMVAVFMFAQENHYYGRRLTDFILHDRTAAQIIVQTVSQLLGFLQIYSLHAAIQLCARARLMKRPTRLGTLGYLMALSNGQVDTSLGIQRFLMTACFVVLSFGPGALWAGAVTPLIIPQLEILNAGVQVPTYSTATNGTWNSQFEIVNGQLLNRAAECTSVGVITNCPVPALQGQLVSAIASASTSDDSPRRHSKTDESSWTYVGRSFGVGSSVGRTTNLLEKSTTLAVNYTEYGYATHVNCTFNSSAAFNVEEIGYILGPSSSANMWGPTGVYGYFATGSLPNSQSSGAWGPENYTVISTFADSQNVLAWAARSREGENYISIAATNGSYSKFNQTQCKVQFDPSAFSVEANFTARTIQVTQLLLSGDDGSPKVPDYQLTENAINTVNLLGRMSSSSFFTSVLGDALNQNLAIRSATPTADDITDSLQEAFQVALDDILSAYGASQIVLAKDTMNVEAVTTSNDVCLGKVVFSRIVLAMSLLFALIQLCIIVSTRFWASLPIFNIFDIKSAIIAASAANNGLAKDLGGASHVGWDDSTIVWGGDRNGKDIASLIFVVHPPSKSNDMPRIESTGRAEMVGITRDVPLEQVSVGIRSDRKSNRWKESTSRLLN